MKNNVVPFLPSIGFRDRRDRPLPPGLDDLPDVTELRAAMSIAAPIHLYEVADGVCATLFPRAFQMDLNERNVWR